MASITNYVKSSFAEMKKVTWPTRKEVYNYTFMVIGISLAIAAFLGALDYGFSYAIQAIINAS